MGWWYFFENCCNPITHKGTISIGCTSSQSSSMLLSHHAVTELRGRSNAVRILVISLASRLVPQSSNLGIVISLRNHKTD